MSREAMKHIKTWSERCEEHPDHQHGMISEGMIRARMQEEIDELRQALEIDLGRVGEVGVWGEWQGLTDDEVSEIINREIGFNSCWGPEEAFARAVEQALKDKNT